MKQNNETSVSSSLSESVNDSSINSEEEITIESAITVKKIKICKLNVLSQIASAKMNKNPTFLNVQSKKPTMLKSHNQTQEDPNVKSQ